MSSTVILFLAVFAASAVEAVEALTIVLAVGVVRGWRSTLLGVGAASLVLAAVVAALGPALKHIPISSLRLVVGGLLLAFGLQWLRKAILRASGFMAQRDEAAAFERERVEAGAAAREGASAMDWYSFTVAFKGVLLEGIEIVLIVSVLAARPSGPAPALIGAALATVAVIAAGAWLRKPLARIPETELKWGVGVLLSAFGVFFAAEGLGVDWPGGDAAILYLAATLGAVSQAQAHWLAREPARA